MEKADSAYMTDANNGDEEQPDPLMPTEAEECVPLIRGFSPGKVDRKSSVDHENQSSLAPMLKVALPPILLFVIGVTFLMYFEDWSMLTACYVITQIVTTIGYGDFIVTHAHSKLFIAVYSLCLLAIFAYYINLVMSRIVAWESSCVRAHLRRLQVDWELASTEKEARNLYGKLNAVVAHVFLSFFVLITGMVFYRLLEHCSCSYGFSAVYGCSEKDFKTCAESGGFVKTWIDVFYMAVITLSTIGFGDVEPKTRWGRLFGIFWMIFGVTATGITVSQLSSWMFEKEKAKKCASADAVDAIDRQVFDKIDRDGSGELSRGEFLTYTLVKYNLVDEKLLDDINSLYDRLDKAGTNAVSYERILQVQAQAKHSQLPTKM